MTNAEAAVEALSSAPDPNAERPKVKFSAQHDEAVKQVFDLADKGRWEEAEAKASGLVEEFPNDPALQRLYNWVSDSRKLIRERAIEDQIRRVDAKNSPFNPTVKSLLTEEKDRGLPPRKDLRDAIQEIRATPYIPDSYGKKIEHSGMTNSPSITEGPMADLLNRRISVHLDDATLGQIIFTLGDKEKINFVADKSMPAFQKKLSVNFDGVRLREFLEYVSRNLDISFQYGEDLIWIVDGKDPKVTKEETRIYRLHKGFVMPARFADDNPTRVEAKNGKGETTAVTTTEHLNLFVPDMAPDKPAIEQAIQEFFKGSKYFIDYERNLIVATGTRDQLEVLENIIKEFDKPIQQVLIEARFITVSEPAFLQLGVAWETGRSLLNQTVPNPTDHTTLAPDQVALPIQETFTNILGRENLTATITALAQSGESQTLSAPRLLLVNNRPGKISDGKLQYYYEQYTVKQTTFERGATSSLVPDGSPTKITSGVELNVVASIGSDGQTILLGLNPKVNQDVQLVTFATITDVDANGEVASRFDLRLPEYRTQELATRVSVKSGQTVVMGGVLQRDQTTYVESVPVLGNLPLLGAFFRRRTEVDAPRYLLIFVTATIVSESGEYVLPKEDSNPPTAAR
ncbi:type II secretion system protein GspD [bacterium]|nr:type II secretion system protein GspD [bacterium]